MEAKRWIESLVGIGMLACFAAGCGDDGGDALTSEEAVAFSGVVGSASVGSLLDLMDAIPTEYHSTTACPEGGRTILSVAMDHAGRSEALSVAITGPMALDNCAWLTDYGETLTLAGSVHMAVHVLRSRPYGFYYPIDIEVQGGWNGSFEWKNLNDASSGACETDVTLGLAGEIPRTGSRKVEGVLTGTVCGIPVDVDGIVDHWLEIGWN